MTKYTFPFGLNGPLRSEDETSYVTFEYRPLARTCSQAYQLSRRGDFKQSCSLLTSILTVQTHVCGVEIIGLYGADGLLRFGTLPLEERAICGVTFGQRATKWPTFFIFCPVLKVRLGRKLHLFYRSHFKT